MSKKNDSNQPDLHADQVKELKRQRALLQRFTDIERFPPDMTMYLLGSAIISLLRDESFINADEKETAEAGALLQDHFSATYRMLQHIQKKEIA